MFDGVGRTNDDDATSRTVASVVLTTALGAGVVALGLGVAAWRATEILASPSPDPMPELVELTMEAETIDEPLPEVPAPPRAALARGEPAPDDPPPPVPDEAADDPPPLAPDPLDAISDAAPPTGDPDGVDGGDPNGDPDGVDGGTSDGIDGGCFGCGGPRVIHHSDVRIIRQTPLRYPAAARDLDLGTVDCRVRVYLDERGRPNDLDFESCPRVFHESTAATLAAWRWTPLRVGGRAVPAQFLLNVRYVPR